MTGIKDPAGASPSTHPASLTRLQELGVEIVTNHAVGSTDAESLTLHGAYTGRESERPATALVLVSARLPNDQLFLDLTARQDAWRDAGIKSVKGIGDTLPFRHEIAELITD